MHAFDFLNVRNISEVAFKDKRTKENKTAYARMMKLKRGEYSDKMPVSKDELETFFNRYKEEDLAFRQYMKNLLTK